MSEYKDWILPAFWVGVGFGAFMVGTPFYFYRKRMLELLHSAPSDSGREG